MKWAHDFADFVLIWVVIINSCDTTDMIYKYDLLLSR